ncbi:DEAD/DEAH box helicase, partial [Chloroflexota bacterium]
TEPISFSDDGPLTALKLMSRLQNAGKLQANHAELLQNAADWEPGDSLDFLTNLTEIQQELIEKFTQNVVLDQALLPNADVENLLTRIINHLYNLVLISTDDPDIVLEEFVHDLEYDVTETEKTILHYARALAATCQQSVSRSMQKTMEDKLVFETIIVDEASRSNPLDLLIPMARAERRIILVGDHRQLPHILEYEAEKRLERSSQETQELLGKSLFERLFRYLQGREGVDGIRRTVTLDQQYRMHPILGQFVSNTFYEQYGERFGSDQLIAEDFTHNIDEYQSKVAAWVNIPARRGKESGGQSKSRLAEARWIAKETKRILEQHDHLSVGVITFYRAQVYKVLSEMVKLGLAEKQDGVLQVSEFWVQHKDIERLRVGTVDAFQGKEFDIVFLSVVRSNDIPADEDDQFSQRKKYGFLTLENRMCVAMSRQKRLLIAVGDEAMIKLPVASVAVPGLTALYELCDGSYGIIKHF